MDQRNSKFEPASSRCATKRSETTIINVKAIIPPHNMARCLAFGIWPAQIYTWSFLLFALYYFSSIIVEWPFWLHHTGGNDYEKRTIITTNVKKGYLIYISLNSNLRPESWMIYFRHTRRATGTWCTEWGFPLIFVIEWASLSEVPLSRWRLRPTLYFICLKPEDSPAGQQAVFMLIKDIEYGHIKRQMPLFVTTSGVLPTARHLPFCTYALP